jgi:primase-polymerase (primpol)-like protein
MKLEDKPKFLNPMPENIPDQLKQYDQWVLWKAEFVEGKWTKVPYNAKTGWKAKSNDPQTWSDFHTAYLKQKHDDGKFDGIGFVPSENDPFTGVDLDHCRDPQSGKIELWAMKIIDQLNSYTEISPSGTGIRIFIKANLPPGRRKTGNIEVYDTKHYLTMTGHRLNGTGHS